MDPNPQGTDQLKPRAKRILIKRERSLKEEIDQVTARAATQANELGLSRAQAKTLLTPITDAAGDSSDYVPVKLVIKKSVRDAQLWTTLLTDVLEKVRALEAQRERNRLFSSEWWEQQRIVLSEAYEKDVQSGHQSWIQTYVQALLAWALDICERLVLEPFPDAADEREVFRAGTQAILDGKYPEALPMLEHLCGNYSGESGAIITSDQRALLEIFKGRIHLSSGNRESALVQFEQARKLAPKSGQPCAALSHYYRTESSSDQAATWAQRGVDLSPELADGYVALGLWAESEDRQNEAIEFYSQAVDKVWREKDPYWALGRLLAPVSSYLLLSISQRLLQEGYNEEALVVLDEAFEQGADKDGKYKDLRGRQLRAEVLEALGRGKEAADVYYEAGRERYDENDVGQAIRFFRGAIKADPDRVHAFWYLMDSLRLSTYEVSGSDDTIREILNESLEVWTKALKISLPDDDYSWAYLTRALINDQLSQLPDAKRTELWWEAVAYLERSILHYDVDASRWAYLSRFFRSLGLSRNALQTSEEALDNDSESTSALEERGALLANIGLFDETEILINKRLEQAPEDIWAKGVKAYIFIHKERYDEALELLDFVAKAGPNDLWYPELRALCYRLVNDRDNAQREYRSILDRLKEARTLPPDDQSTIAAAALQLGELDEAEGLFKSLVDDSAEASGAYCGLGLCYLIRSESLAGEEKKKKLKESRQAIYRGINLASNVRELDDFVAFDLREFEEPSYRWSGDDDQKKSLALIKQRVRKRRKVLERPQSPAEELQQTASELTSTNEKTGWPWIAVQASLARLATADKRWAEAAEIYDHLRQDNERFPEAKRGLEVCVDELSSAGARRLKENKPSESVVLFKQALAFERGIWKPDKVVTLKQQLGDALLKDGQPGKSLENFTEVEGLLRQLDALPILGQAGTAIVGRAFRFVRRLFKGTDLGERVEQLPISKSSDESNTRKADLAVRLSLTRFLLGEIDASRKDLADAFQLYASANTTEPGVVVGKICGSLLNDVKSYWSLHDQWVALIDDAATDEKLKSNLAQALDALTSYLSDVYDLSDKSGESSRMLPVTAPIRLELNVELPADPENSSPLFTTYLPEMRKRIQAELGIQVPGVRVMASSDMPPNRYAILLDEVRVEDGEIQPEMRYCPVSVERLKEMGIDAEARALEAPHPTTGQPGCWVARDLWPLVIERNLELWDDPLLYMMYHLDAVLCRNLADFLGTQEFKNLLETWRQTETGQALVEAVAPDQMRELRLGRTLRSLLKEQVPITNWEEILKTVKTVGLPTHDVHEVVRAVRLRLKQQIPGNTPNARAIELPSEIEKTLGRWLHNEGGKMFIAIPPVPAKEFVRDVSELVESNPDALLIVESAELRPFVRRILKLRFPGIRVLTRAELVSQPSSVRKQNGSSKDHINQLNINA